MNANKVVVALAVCLFLSSIAVSQPGREAESSSENPRSTPAMSPEAFELFSGAQSCVENNDFACARELIYEVTAMPGLNEYEKSQFWNFRAFVEFAEGDIAQATLSYENVLRLQNLPEGMKQGTLYSLAQLYLMNEQYGRALDAFDRWLEKAEKPHPQVYFVQASALHGAGRHDEAIEAMDHLIDAAEASGLERDEDWYRLRVAIYYDIGEYALAAETLEFMLQEWPAPEYHLQLAGIYGLLDQPERQLELYETAYESGWLTESDELQTFATLLYFADRSHEALIVIQTGFENGVVSLDARSERLRQQLENTVANGTPEQRTLDNADGTDKAPAQAVSQSAF